MQTVSRTKIEALHSEIHKAIMDARDADDWQDAAHYILDILPRSFNALFGSKCLPDEKEFAENANCKESKPEEPKFKRGDKVLRKYHDYEDEELPYDIFEGYHGKDKQGYICGIESIYWLVHESDLEPYTEPDENYMRVDGDLNKAASTCTGDCQSQCKSQDHFVVNNEMVDRIIKDGFSKERRLNIATIIAAGMAFNWCTEPQGGSLRDKCQRLAKLSLMVTDTLITESEKGGSEHGED